MNSAGPLTVVALFLVGCASAPIGTRSVPAAAEIGCGESRAELLQLTDQLFSAVHSRDTTALRPMFLPEAVLVAVGRTATDAPVRTRTVDTFLQVVAASQDPIVEQLQDPTTYVDHDVGVLSSSYVAHAGGRYSHCGHETLHFIRREGSWRIASITSTVAPGPCG